MGVQVLARSVSSSQFDIGLEGGQRDLGIDDQPVAVGHEHLDIGADAAAVLAGVVWSG